jgi:hypothetical protein
MALSFAQQSARAASGDYRAIVDAVIARELPYILAEDAATPGHDKRIALGLAMVRPGGFGAYGEIFYRLMAGDINVRSVDVLGDITEGAWGATFASVYSVICGNTVDTE